MNHFLQLCNKKWPKVRSINNDESIEIIVVDPYYNDESMKIVVVREPTYIETKPLHP